MKTRALKTRNGNILYGYEFTLDSGRKIKLSNRGSDSAIPIGCMLELTKDFCSFGIWMSKEELLEIASNMVELTECCEENKG